MTQLTQSQGLALKYLKSKYPEFLCPAEVGRVSGNQKGREPRPISLCQMLANTGLAVKNEAGHYAAATK